LPENLSQLTDLLSRHRGEARIFAGGTDLLVQIREDVLHPKHVLSTKNLPGLDKIELAKGSLKIGSLATVRAVEKSSVILGEFPVIAEAAQGIASIQIRNVATIGGNLCQNIKCAQYNQSHINEFMRRSMPRCYKKGGSACLAPVDSLHHSITDHEVCRASFVSDLGLALHCLDASLIVTSKKGEREVPIRKFYKGPAEFDLENDEFVRQVVVSKSNSRMGTAYAKYRQAANGYGIVTAAASVALDSSLRCRVVRISVGGVAPIPHIATEAEKCLKGQVVNQSTIEEASRKVLESVKARGPAGAFKIAMARNLVKTVLGKAAQGGVQKD
jgi:xanthine dehydrogenase YagS FAD-binding subunit